MIKKIANSITNSVVSGWQKLPKKRILTFVGMFLFCAVATFAQSKGAGGFSTAIKEVSSYEEPRRQPHEGYRSSDCTGRFILDLLQDAERRPRRQEGYHAHHRWLCCFPCNESGFAFVL